LNGYPAKFDLQTAKQTRSDFITFLFSCKVPNGSAVWHFSLFPFHTFCFVLIKFRFLISNVVSNVKKIKNSTALRHRAYCLKSGGGGAP